MVKLCGLLTLALVVVMHPVVTNAMVHDVTVVLGVHCQIGTEVVPGSGRFGSFSGVQEAAEAATNVYNPVSMLEDREYMGAILRHHDKDEYVYTVGAGKRGADQVTVRIQIPKGFAVAAFWHTHGEAGASRHLFSEGDTSLVEQLQVPLFLADYTGDLKVYSPDDHTLWLHGIPVGGDFGRGQEVRDWKSGDTVTIGTKEDKTCWCLHQSLGNAVEII